MKSIFIIRLKILGALCSGTPAESQQKCRAVASCDETGSMAMMGLTRALRMREGRG
jgi:hypothetical protein